MTRRLAVAAALAILSTSCLGGGSADRIVLVDYRNDEFASAYFSYFPNHIDAHPGDTVSFHQAWSGEPHSVTMGKIVDKFGQLLKPYLKIFAKNGYAGIPEEPPKALEKYDENLPWMIDEDGNVAQNGAQPCFVKKGLPPKDPKETCSKAEHTQPVFDGTYNFYNSGFIPYEGPQGDTFNVKLADDIKPGEHFFYCNYHGPFMSGFLQIKPADEELTSSGQIAREARREIAKAAEPLGRDFRTVQKRRYEPKKDELEQLAKFPELTRRQGGKTYFDGWAAGWGTEGVDTAIIDEFIPRNVTAKAGEKLTWLILGAHTISFNVPKYFPIIETAKDGTISMNKKIKPSFGGAPNVERFGEEHHPSGAVAIDAPAWDGKGFWSTGYVEAYDNPVVYSLRITRPGTYKFACLIHPPMVGTLVVS